MNPPKVEVITVDGPTASGKGTIASKLAQVLGFHYLDSGALFRLTALSCLSNRLDLSDAASCAQAALKMKLRFEEGKIFLFDQDVTDAIREEKIGIAASQVATMPAVREAILSLERGLCREPGLVADGRDMGTVVFPQARLKIFLTASAKVRAERRYKQLIQRGISANLADLTHDLEERDRRDRERTVSPMRPAADARLLDSSEMTIDETVNRILSWYRTLPA